MPAFVIRARDGGGAVLATTGCRGAGVRLARAGDDGAIYFTLKPALDLFGGRAQGCVCLVAAGGAYLAADGGGGGGLELVAHPCVAARFALEPQADGSVHLRTTLPHAPHRYVSWLSAPASGVPRPRLVASPPDATCAWVLEPAPAAPQPDATFDYEFIYKA
jgi:hypothetical protein